MILNANKKNMDIIWLPMKIIDIIRIIIKSNDIIWFQ